METEILLEDVVECKYTGLKGVAMSKTKFVNGCIQFGVAPKFDPKENAVMEVNVDSQSLKVIKKGPRHKKIVKQESIKESTGGPSRIMRRRM